MDELLAEFLAETNEGLAAADEALLRLERAPDDRSTMDVVFRLLHTIKGTCGFLDLPRLERLSHAAEDLLGALRDGSLAVTSPVITAVLAAVDGVKALVTAIASGGQEPPGDDAALIARLQATMLTGAPAPQAAADATSPQAREAGPEAPQTIRVNVGTLETLMTLVSELVLTRNQLLQIARLDEDTRFNAALQRLSHLTSDLQEGVMKTRMQPIGHAWGTFRRMVRDLAGELGKKITLVTSGDETELDRHMLELVRGPLTHMVRNCADHGIERQADRVAAGKHACGTIALRSYHEGGTVVIEVADDGGGLPTARIRDRALADGLVTAAEIAGWGTGQINRLIFRPGLSTATAVTAISGRGVGMDVVATNIERLGGTVDVASQDGGGTTFTVRIPLTLAIISALVVDAGGQRFALPQTCVAELVRVEAGSVRADGQVSVERIDGTPVLRLRDKLLPLVDLAALLGLTAVEREDGALTVVVAQLGGLNAGLLVDEVFDTEEIVVKPASRLLRHIPVFSGNTILGDGSVIMILDPNGLSRAIGEQATPAPALPVDTAGLQAEQSGDQSPMLLVRLSEGAGPVAVPLALVARIESIPKAAIQVVQGKAVTPYRGRLMPLVAPGGLPSTHDLLPVLVFADRDRTVGLVVAQIVDVVEQELSVELASAQPGTLGTALLAGQVTEVLDTGYWLIQGRPDWFTAPRLGRSGVSRLLIVEDSAFHRQLLIPALSAQGYHVTAVDSASKALAMRDAGDAAGFDAIISDVEMPGMDGLQFARALRRGGAWSSTPLVALTAHTDPALSVSGRDAGFDELVSKFDRDGLLQALGRHVGPREQMAA